MAFFVRCPVGPSVVEETKFLVGIDGTFPLRPQSRSDVLAEVLSNQDFEGRLVQLNDVELGPAVSWYIPQDSSRVRIDRDNKIRVPVINHSLSYVKIEYGTVIAEARLL